MYRVSELPKLPNGRHETPYLALYSGFDVWHFAIVYALKESQWRNLVLFCSGKYLVHGLEVNHQSMSLKTLRDEIICRPFRQWCVEVCLCTERKQGRRGDCRQSGDKPRGP